MLAKSFCVGMRLMVKHFFSVSSLRMRATLLRARTKATKHGLAPHLVPKTEEGEGATICRQTHVDFVLGSQRADLRALHAQRKHCDQCHVLRPSEGKSEASYSPEAARVVDDGSVSSTTMQGHILLQQQCQPLRRCGLNASHTLHTHPTSCHRIFTSLVH